MRELAAHCTVVCIEYFGVGFSSTTLRARTVENFVQEIRAALLESGLTAPYVLMPHSMSSVYAEYYATKYPRDVAAIISLDGTSSAHYETMPRWIRWVLRSAAVLQAAGIVSLLALITTNKKKLASHGYSKKEIEDSILFAGFSMNKNLIDQMLYSGDHVKTTKEMPFPASVPFLKIISRDTYETANKQLKMTPQEYQEQHLKRVGSNARYEILEGNHFIHANNAQRIAGLSYAFLTELPRC